jgi:hypothetical protein
VASPVPATDGVTVSVTVPSSVRPPVAPPPSTSIPHSPRPVHHPHGHLAYTGLPASQLLLAALVLAVIGVVLTRVRRSTPEAEHA